MEFERRLVINLENEELIEALIFDNQFEKPQAEKERLLVNIMKNQLEANKTNENIKKLYKSRGFHGSCLKNLKDVPFIPVNMFKEFDLITCDSREVFRVLNSSATTSGIPSKIYLDKATSRRQSQALTATLRNFLGSKRRPLLFIDTMEVNSKGGKLTARGAAVRGMCSFGNDICYVMEKNVDGTLDINMEKLIEFQNKYKDEEILVYGFTYIIWSRFVKKLLDQGIRLNLPNMKLLHSGGWKKLTSEKVSKEEFSRAAAELFGTSLENIIDFYGMVEQVGVVFIDCPCGNKHVPDFAEVIIRDINTLDEVSVNETGIIEVMSILGSSYPSQAVLTEDMGEFMGIDDCGCGRKGKYFRFKARVEKSETRGCGDTFAEREGERP